MSILLFNNPILSTRRKGTVGDEYIPLSQSILVKDNKVLLSEIPDQFQHVAVSGLGVNWVEIYRDLPTENQFLVDYSMGIVYFHPSRNNSELQFTFKGTGCQYFPHERIWTKNDGITVTETLGTLIDNGRLAIDAVGGITTAISTAQALGNSLDSKITTWNALNATLTDDISSGTILKGQLETGISSASASKSNLDTSILQGNTLKSDLDFDINIWTALNSSLQSDIGLGSTLKTNLDSSISTATTKKSDLDASNTTAASTKTALDGSNITALATKGALDALNTTANTTKTDLDDSNTTALATKTALDTSNTTANNTNTALMEANTTAVATKTALDDSISTGDTTKTNLDDSISAGVATKSNLDDSISSATIIEGTLNGAILSADIPTQLSQLTGDSTHQTVTEVEKAAWNNMQESLGYTPEDVANKGVSNGYSSLDNNGKVPLSQIPDLNLDWTNISNKPTSTITEIDDAVTDSHTHSNKTILDDTTASYTTTEQTKLSDIEPLADVTDTTNVGSAVYSSTEKTTPVDADQVAAIDSGSFNVMKKITWSNIKATLKAYFDTLYNNYVHPLTHSPSIIEQDASNRFVTNTEITTWNAKADTNSPVLTGNPQAPTPDVSDDSTTIATTAFVKAQAEVLSLYRSDKDSNGLYTTLQWKRLDGTLAKKSVLSNGISPNYTTRTVTYYATDGITLLSTEIYAETYSETDLVSEVLV